jgi:hypothetical protein
MLLVYEKVMVLSQSAIVPAPMVVVPGAKVLKDCVVPGMKVPF